MDRINQNESFSKFVTEYNVGRFTIYDIKQNRENLLNEEVVEFFSKE